MGGGSDSPSLAHWRSTKFNKSNKSTKSTKSSGRSDEDGSGAGASSSREISLRLNPTYVKKHKIKLLPSARSTKSSVVELSAKGLSSPDNDSLRLEVGVAQESDRGIFGGMFGSDRDRECTPCAPWFPSQLLKRGSDGGPDSIPSQNSSASAIHLEPLSRDATLYEREANKMPPKRTKWWQVTLYIINDTIGAWLILFSSISLALYGWVLGMLILVFMWPLNMYAAHLLWRCRNVFPGAISIGDLVFYLTRSTIAMYVTFFFVNITILFTLATQIHAVSSAFTTFFEKSRRDTDLFGGTCFALYISVTIAIMLPLTQLRYLHSLTLINIINVLCVLVFVSVSIYSLSQLGLVPQPTQIGPNVEAIKGYLFDENETGPLLGIELLYASFHYQLVILEMMSEMRNPADFPKANYWATPFIIFVAVAMAATRYYYYGESEELYISADKVIQSTFQIDKKGRTPLAIVGVVCFSIHIMGSAVIRSVILTRFFQLLIHPSVVNIKTWRSRIEWLAVSLLVLALAWVLSLFQSLGLVSTITGILAIILTSILPCVLYVVLCKKRKALTAIPWYEWVLITFLCIFGLAIIIADFVKIGVPGADARINQTANQTMYEVKAAFQCPI